MSLVSSKKIGTNLVELVIEIKGDVFKKAVDNSFNKNSKKITLPGFRKGKAPRSMIEKYYGKEYFYDDAINEVYPQAYEEAAKEAKLEVVDTENVEVVTVNDEGVTLKAKVVTKPEATLGEYKGLEAEFDNKKATEKQLEEELKLISEKYSRLVPVEDRKSQLGDTLNINFDGFCEGKRFDGGKAENYDLELGSGTFIPGFEDQCVDRNVGDEFDVNVKFPDGYGDEKISGKDATFKCKVNEIKLKELPKLDDDFAKDVSDFETFDEYKKDLKAKLDKEIEDKCQADFEDRLLDKIVEGLKVDIPDVMIRNAVNEEVSDYGMRLQQYGMQLDAYLKYAGQTIDQFALTFRPTAEKKVKIRLALEAIAKKEELKVSKEELDNEFKRLAENYKMEVEKFKSYVTEEDLTGDLACQKALKFVVDNAKKVAMKEKKEPAKKETKTTAKKTEKKSTAKKEETK